MNIYQTKTRKLSGTQYAEVYKKAFDFYRQIKRQTKRRPYVRSAFFNKEKVFLGIFWQHFHQKNWHDRARRIRFFLCAIELIQHSRIYPESKVNPNDPSEFLHRFTGKTPDQELFRVHIKEDRKSGQKWLLSIFPGKENS